MSNKIVKICGIIADEPTANGRIYPKEVLEKAITEVQDRVNDGKIMVHCGNDLEVNLNDVIGVVRKLELNDGKIMVEIEKSPHSTVELDSIKINPIGIGNIGDDGKVFDYDLASFGISK